MAGPIGKAFRGGRKGPPSDGFRELISGRSIVRPCLIRTRRMGVYPAGVRFLSRQRARIASAVKDARPVVEGWLGRTPGLFDREGQGGSGPDVSNLVVEFLQGTVGGHRFVMEYVHQPLPGALYLELGLSL